MSQGNYFRPLVQVGPARPNGALTLAGGWGWFTHVEVLRRDGPASVVNAAEVPEHALETLARPRPAVAGLDLGRPQIMGILNTTPDSFSDGGKHVAAANAILAGRVMADQGADILDIGGESTRPGAQTIDAEEEIRRTAPVIAGLRAAGVTLPISIDTRKEAVAEAALNAGATLVNDVSGLTYDTGLAPLCARRDAPVCVMHALGDPATMQQDPNYDNVVLDVFDFLKERITELEVIGIPRARIIADPGIGFGKTQTHNLALLSRLGLFHSLGVPILLGASRKRFIGTIGKAEVASNRAPGSIGVALAALAHGIQVLRVHDVDQTRQAIALWRAALTGNAT